MKKTNNTNSSSYSEFSANTIREYVEKATNLRALAIESEKAAGRPTFVEFTTNSKLQGIATFGTLPVIDCGKACKDCARGCYAVRHQAIRFEAKLEKMARNSARLANDRDAFFMDIENRCKLSIVFRWHESGEIVDADYFARIVNVAKNTPRTDHLIFTKRADIVNQYIKDNGPLPENLHVLLSAWKNLAAIENPYNLPLSAPDFSNAPQAHRQEFNPAGLNRINCGGDCSKCYINRAGCFSAKGGDVVVFIAH